MQITKRSTKITFFLFILINFSLYSEKNLSTWDGSRSIPVHRIPIMDENNQQIIPTEPYPLPYSTRYTCGPCHDYEKILKGLHFNEGNAQVESGRPGEPWFWLDKKTGTILPVSSRQWPGAWNLEQTGLTPWSFTLLFGRHMTGGGLTDPGNREVSPGSRWYVSGALEINCMGCHNASRIQSHSEWAKQVMRQNLRWAATAASSLGEVGGMASRLPNTWDIYDGPNPDDNVYAIVPTVKYDQNRFDSKHRVFFDILREPGDERCLTCHSTAIAGKERYQVDGDVHTASGIRCVQCHRNGLDHRMIRGYEGEAAGSADFTCRGCHSGKSKGRLGAPWPKHRGIPAVHFDRLSCTVCHSGPLPGENPVRVRTSRANRLGIYGIAQWFTEAPHIVEPVYKKGSDGKLAPFRLTWPAFWAIREGDKAIPIKPDAILEPGKGILDVEERIAKILFTLSTIPDIEGEPVLLAGGKVFRGNYDGLLDVSAYPGDRVEEMLWLVEIENNINPLIPDFDTTAERLDIEVEKIITGTLEALLALQETAAKPALVYKDKIYHLVEGYLEAAKYRGEPVKNPQLFWLKEGRTIPLISLFEKRTVLAVTGLEESLTEEQVKMILIKIKENLIKSSSPANNRKPLVAPRAAGLKKVGQKFLFTDNAEPVYISGGKLFKLDEQGNLLAGEHEAAAPVTWPMAHDVRPARLALGVNGCKDCHTASSAFFFTRVKGAGPLKTDQKAVRSMHTYMGKDKYYETLFGFSFTFRPILKIILFISIFFTASILLVIFLLALGRFSGIFKKRK